MTEIPATLEIQVTEDDIENGARGVDDFCPIALAIRRRYPEFVPSVLGHGMGHEADISLYAREDLDHLNYLYAIPEQAAEFIDTFDADLPVSPFAFTATFKETL